MSPARPGDPGPRRLGDALERLLGTMAGPSIDVLETVFHRWEEIVGPDVANHTRPSAIDGGRLVVTADDPTWASELRWLETELLSRLAELSASDRITSLTVRVGPLGDSR